MAQKDNPGCLTAFLNLFRTKKKSERISETPPVPNIADPMVAPEIVEVKEPEKFPFFKRDDFLSVAEASFFHVLKNISGENVLICPKVSLADIFYVTRPDINMPYYNKINRKHVDFLLCDPKTLKPYLAIELDDSSHTKADRIERDEYVDKVFEAAGLPIAHIPCRAAYNTDEIRAALRNAMRKAPLPPAEQEQEDTTWAVGSEPPLCPKCGSRMVLRTAQRGSHAGQQFYGCPNFPKCRETIIINSQSQT